MPACARRPHAGRVRHRAWRSTLASNAPIPKRDPAGSKKWAVFSGDMIDIPNGTPPSPASRRGGRAARVALRAASLSRDRWPVDLSLEDGTYSPLVQEQVERIYATALDALDQTGMAKVPPSGVESLIKAGCILDKDARIHIPRAVVAEMREKTAKTGTLPGLAPAHDLEMSGRRVPCGTAGATVHIVDLETGRYRESSAQDVNDVAKLVQHLDIITIYIACADTTKHIATCCVESDHLGCLKRIHQIAGDEEAFQDRPFISKPNCFVGPPMTFAEESSQVMAICVRACAQMQRHMISPELDHALPQNVNLVALKRS